MYQSNSVKYANSLNPVSYNPARWYGLEKIVVENQADY